MSGLLRIGQTVDTQLTKQKCKVESFLGGGGQGEVYKATVTGGAVAVKWYFPGYLSIDPGLKGRLERAVQKGAPTPKFLWPKDLVSAEGTGSFGYVMPLREPTFKGFDDLKARRVNPTFRVLVTAGFELAHSYEQLHADGMCYRDVNDKNVFFEPGTGDVRICDNDNVDVNGQPGGIAGMLDFMAPEIVRGEAAPTSKTDLHSLATLLFQLLHNHHPLMGRRMMNIRCLDLPAKNELFGFHPVFIFDPRDRSNEAVDEKADSTRESGANALVFWSMYPTFLQELFTRAFTTGLRDADARVRETEWRAAMVRLRDSILYCRCGAESFYDQQRLAARGVGTCWKCRQPLAFPYRIKIGKNVIMLTHDAKIFPHHVDDQRMYDFSAPIAAVVTNPGNPNVWGLKNLTGQKWTCTPKGGAMQEVGPHRSVTIAEGTVVNFGCSMGEIRWALGSAVA